MTQPKTNSNSIKCSIAIVQLLCYVMKMVRKKTKFLMFFLSIRLEEDELCLKMVLSWSAFENNKTNKKLRPVFLNKNKYFLLSPRKDLK